MYKLVREHSFESNDVLRGVQNLAEGLRMPAEAFRISKLEQIMNHVKKLCLRLEFSLEGIC